MISLTVASNFLVICCVVVTAITCTWLTVASSDRALGDTKDSRDESVNTCFKTGLDSVTNRTEEYLNTLLVGTKKTLSQHFNNLRAMCELQLNLMATAKDDQELSSWDFMYQKRSVLYSLKEANFKYGLSALGIANKKDAILAVLEDPETINEPLENFHHTITLLNNGSDHAPPGVPTRNMLHWGSSIPNDGGVMREDDFHFHTEEDPCVTWGVGMPYTPHQACFNRSGDKDIYSLVFIGMLVPPGIDNIRWSPPTSLGPYVVTTAFGTYTDSTGAVQGLVYISADIRMVSQFLSSLQIPGDGRVFTLMSEQNWLFLPINWHLTGTSHGHAIQKGTFGGSIDWSVELLPAINATDDTIKQTAIHIETAYPKDKYRELVVNGTIEYSITGQDGPKGYFASAANFNDGHGIDWYIVSVVDRHYVLGEVDRATEATRISIESETASIDDQLKQDRLVMILVIVGVAIFLMTASFFAVLGVTKPIFTLKEEMASVAVMKLEIVDEDRSGSIFNEIAAMQSFFLLMVKRLREYREYMPASILLDESDDEDEDCTATSRDGTQSVTISLKSSSGEKTSTSVSTLSKKLEAHRITTEIRQKRVTVAMANIVGFLSEGRISKHREYLALALHCCVTLKGVPDSFSGDRFIMTWNGAKLCGEHAVNAVTACLDLIRSNSERSYTVSTAVAGGTVKAGNMGCDGLKKYTMVGPVLPLAFILERLNKVFQTSLLIDSTTESEAQRIYYTKLEDQLEYKKASRHNNKIRVHSIISKKQMEEAEWMYQIEGAESRHPAKQHNLAMDHYCNGEFSDAISTLLNEEIKRKVEIAKQKGKNYISSLDLEVL
eukprot:TRINITY_DN20181_c0_g1_i1.p1 TRINITY_DN20181_c0_g1~~TRINITY_DN20181_c0_g1_i1.p1  ORF type:complete len:859 (+),score=157.18 TRINITY_DN20181_c0_g1_i1:73-2577(+)